MTTEAKNAEIGKIQGFLKSGKYLPRFLRDFHDQKELFKKIDRFYRLSERAENASDVTNPKWLEDSHLKGYSWVCAHVYVIDFFLWFMGLHGYTLQKTRTRNIEFCDIDDTLTKAREERIEIFAKIMDEEFKKRKEESLTNQK